MRSHTLALPISILTLLIGAAACSGDDNGASAGDAGGAAGGEGEGEGDVPDGSEGEGEAAAGAEGEGEGEAAAGGEGEGEGEGPAAVCPDPIDRQGACEPDDRTPSSGDIDVSGSVRNLATGANATDQDRLWTYLSTPGVFGCESTLHGTQAVCDDGRVSFPDAGVACLSGITVEDMDCGEGAGSWLTTFTAVHLLGTNADTAESKSGLNLWAIKDADMETWSAAAKTFLDDDDFVLHHVDKDPGCLVVRAADADGAPLAGATIKYGAAEGMDPTKALYFNETMDGFVEGGVTSASGVIILPIGTTGAYSVVHPDHTFPASLGQGGPNGVCVIAEVRAQ